MYLNEVTVFSPEQITASMLNKLKDISEANLKTKVVDCVLSVSVALKSFMIKHWGLNKNILPSYSSYLQ